MKVLLRGYYGFGNFGDDLLLLAAYEIIRAYFPEATIHVFANDTAELRTNDSSVMYREYLEKLLGGKVPLVDWRDKMSFDLEVLGGGGVFMAGGTVPSLIFLNSICINLGAKRVAKALGFCRWILRRPVRRPAQVKLAIGVGIDTQYVVNGNVIHNLEELGSTSLVGVRDEHSSKNAEKLGVQCIRGSDLAFRHRELFFRHRIEKSKRSGVGIVLCARKMGNEKIIQKLRLEDPNDNYTFIFFDERFDRDLIKKVQELGFSTLVWRPHNLTIADFLNALATFEIMVSNRFHGIICAALLGIPSITLVTDSKLRSLSGFFPDSTVLFSFEGREQDIVEEISKLRWVLQPGSTECEVEIRRQVDLLNFMLKEIF